MSKMAQDEAKGTAEGQAQRGAHWYVVHVQTGQERKMCQFIERACERYNNLVKHPSERLQLDEVFAPQLRSQKK